MSDPKSRMKVDGIWNNIIEDPQHYPHHTSLTRMNTLCWVCKKYFTSVVRDSPIEELDSLWRGAEEWSDTGIGTKHVTWVFHS
jgi:hypothetical protein